VLPPRLEETPAKLQLELKSIEPSLASIFVFFGQGAGTLSQQPETLRSWDCNTTQTAASRPIHQTISLDSFCPLYLKDKENKYLSFTRCARSICGADMNRRRGTRHRIRVCETSSDTSDGMKERRRVCRSRGDGANKAGSVDGRVTAGQGEIGLGPRRKISDGGSSDRSSSKGSNEGSESDYGGSSSSDDGDNHDRKVDGHDKSVAPSHAVACGNARKYSNVEQQVEQDDAVVRHNLGGKRARECSDGIAATTRPYPTLTASNVSEAVETLLSRAGWRHEVSAALENVSTVRAACEIVHSLQRRYAEIGTDELERGRDVFSALAKRQNSELGSVMLQLLKRLAALENDGAVRGSGGSGIGSGVSAGTGRRRCGDSAAQHRETKRLQHAVLKKFITVCLDNSDEACRAVSTSALAHLVRSGDRGFDSLVPKLIVGEADFHYGCASGLHSAMHAMDQLLSTIAEDLESNADVKQRLRLVGCCVAIWKAAMQRWPNEKCAPKLATLCINATYASALLDTSPRVRCAVVRLLRALSSMLHAREVLRLALVKARDKDADVRAAAFDVVETISDSASDGEGGGDTDNNRDGNGDNKKHSDGANDGANDKVSDVLLQAETVRLLVLNAHDAQTRRVASKILWNFIAQRHATQPSIALRQLCVTSNLARYEPLLIENASALFEAEFDAFYEDDSCNEGDGNGQDDRYSGVP